MYSVLWEYRACWQHCLSKRGRTRHALVGFNFVFLTSVLNCFCIFTCFVFCFLVLIRSFFLKTISHSGSFWWRARKILPMLQLKGEKDQRNVLYNIFSERAFFKTLVNTSFRPQMLSHKRTAGLEYNLKQNSNVTQRQLKLNYVKGARF